MTKMYLQSFVTFTRNEVRGTYLVFQKRRFQGFISEILRVVGPLGEQFTFLNSLGTAKISSSLRRSVYINVVLLISFQNNLNYSSTSNIGEVIKFYNLGHKTFETDFSISMHNPCSILLLKSLNTTCQLYHDLQSFASEFHEITNISIPRNLAAPTLSPG